MDSYAVAASILAFSDFLGVVSKSIYGEKISIRTEIQGFRQGSFDIDFAVHVAGITATLLTGAIASPKELIVFIKDCVSLWRHLKGAPSRSIERSADKQDSIRIENQNGEFIYLNADVINVVSDPKAAKAAETFIRRPLEDGAESLRISSRTSVNAIDVLKSDAPSFGPVAIDTPLVESESTIGLAIESPTFKEGNKWRFFDGQNSFYAEVADEEFLAKVNDGRERFGKGDILIVRMKTTQVSALETLKIERTILEVIKHKIGYHQQPLWPD